MIQKQTLKELREILAGLYPNEDDARRIVADAGLNPRFIPFSGNPVNNWYNILQEAQKRNDLDALVRIAAEEYAGHVGLQEMLRLIEGEAISRGPATSSERSMTAPDRSIFDQRGQNIGHGEVNTGGGDFGGRNITVRELATLAQNVGAADACQGTGQRLYQQGDYTTARLYLEKALEIRLSILGEQHPDTADSLNNLGALLQATGDYAGARSYYERALTIRRTLLGEDHLDTASSLNNLGALLQALGDYTSARSYYERALAIRQKVLGEQHPDTASSYNNLGSLLNAIGDLAAAQPYLERALAIREAVLGKEHPDTALSYTRLGNLFQATGDLTAAQPLYERALTIYQAVLGDQHPDTARSYNNLGLLHSSLGNYTSALPYFERALAIFKVVLGEQHPNTAYTLGNLGLLYATLGNHETALPYLEEALASYSKLLGDQHPDTLGMLKVLIAFHSGLGDDQAALPYAQRWLGAARGAGDRQNEGEALNLSAALNTNLAQYTTALEQARAALAIGEEINNQEIINEAWVNVATALVNLGEPEEAQRFCERALVAAQAEHNRHRESQALNILGQVAYAQGQPTIALPYFQQALSGAGEVNDRRLEGQILGNLALVYSNFEREPESIPYYTHAVAIAQEFNDRRWEKELLANLGLIYNKLQTYTEAVTALERVIVLADEQGDSRQAGNSHGNLADAYFGLQQYRPALEHYQAAVDLMRSVADRRGVSYRLANLGDTYINLGQPLQAVPCYAEALTLAQELSDQRRQQLLQNLAQTHGDLGQVDEALSYYKQLLDQVRSNDRSRAAELLLAMGQLAQSQQRIAQAHQYLTESCNLYAELKLPHAQSVASLVAALEASHPDLFSLVEMTQRYMAQAGFELTPTVNSTIFLCRPTHSTWLEHTEKLVPVKILLGAKLEMNMAQKLVEDSTQLLGELPHCIIVVYDQSPTDDAWLQIAALRATGINIMPVDDSILHTGLLENRQREVLLAHLEDKYLGPQRDLYDRQNPISDRLNFFGRAALADQLIDGLLRSHAMAIFGLRKMGKSSLLNYVRDQLSYPTAVIDLQLGTTLKDVYERIVKAWLVRLRVLQPTLTWQPPPLSVDETPAVYFSRVARGLLATLDEVGAKAQLAVFVDEIDLIYPRSEAELAAYLDFARTLRGLAQEYLGKFGLIVAGLDPNIVRTNRLFGQQNPFYNFFRVQYLPPLSYDDCRQMIRNIGVQMGLIYEDEAIDFVATVSGGHPYWARKLCSLAFQAWKDKQKPGAITHHHLIGTMRHFLQNPDTVPLVSGLWDEVTDRYLWSEDNAAANEAILLALAESEQCTRSDLLQEAAKPAAYQRSLTELDARAIIDEVGADAFWIHLQLFRHWIRTDKLGKE